MKLWKSLLTAAVFTAIGTGTSFADGPMVASIAVNNIADHDITIHCMVDVNTEFYGQPGVRTKDIEVKVGDAPSIDIEEIVQGQGLTNQPANLVCTNLTDGRDWFGYTMVKPYDETVTVHGYFHYDAAYPGSVTFENR